MPNLTLLIENWNSKNQIYYKETEVLGYYCALFVINAVFTCTNVVFTH